MRKHILAGKPTALFVADMHLRLKAPRCRDQEEYVESEFRKIEQLNEWCVRYNAPLVVAGDLGHKAKWPNFLLTKTINSFKARHWNRIVIPGQHDLPNHRLKEWFTGALGVLHAIGEIVVITDLEENLVKWNGQLISFAACPYGEKVLHIRKEKGVPNILIMHKLVTKDNSKYLGQNAVSARKILRRYNQYDLIVTGDNHEPFVIKENGRMLINCGSMMRNATDQIDHRPRAYLWSAETNNAIPLYFPIKQGVINTKHKDNKNMRKRMKIYIKKLTKQFESSLSFTENMRRLFSTETIDMKIQKKVWGFIDGDKAAIENEGEEG